MRYADVKTYVEIGLSAKGYGEPDKPMPLFDPGPGTDERLQKASPDAIVFLSLGDGRGFTTELIFDTPFIRVRTVGPQGANSYEVAETIAYDVDNVLCSADGNTQVGNTTALYITRAGGAPAALQYDSSDRYHLYCTYITETPSGL